MTIFEIIRPTVETIRNNDKISPLEALDKIINNQDLFNQLYATSALVGIEISEIELRESLNSYRLELLRVQQLKDGDFADPAMRNGYVLNENEEKCFGNYFKGLKQNGLLSDQDLNRVINECNVIVQQFLPQPSQNVDKRGLVIGQVQSGKTTIFNGLISAAADIGFNIIIILSGTIESLRRQTQSRITKDVTDPWSNLQSKPFYFTWISNHNGSGMAVPGNARQVLTELNNRANRQIALGVFLKNGFVLKNLKNWLSTIDSQYHDNLRVLIIDDEADQATPNAGVRTETIARINLGIKKLVVKNNNGNSDCPTQGRTSYLGFTATPFANLLNEAGDDTLYPRDFLYFLKSSSKYYGPWQLFGNPDEVEGQETILPLNIIRLLNKEDIEATVPPTGRQTYNPQISEGLKRAILWYILASCAKRCSDKSAWSTMLIHTSSKTSDHESLWKVVNNFLEEIRKFGWQNYKQEMKNLWEEETRNLPEGNFALAFPNYGQAPSPYPEWDNIVNEFPYVIKDIKVKIDNSLYSGDSRMQFGDSVKVQDRLQIGIGGNTLSRGITLEGLVSSYFARRFTNTSSYDTLLQMGRWFGYRVGYELLPRLWTTEFLRESFRDLVIMEQNLRDQMNIYLGGESPANKAPVITQMPAMAITRRSVIGNIQTGDVNYAGTAPQTILFNNNKTWLQQNIDTTFYLLNSIKSYIRNNPPLNNKIYYDNVPLNYINIFLTNYNILPGRNVFNKDHICGFINKNQIEYKHWTIVVIGGSSNKDFEINDGIRIKKNNRTRIKDNADSAKVKINLKSLRSTSELLADQPSLLPGGSFDKASLWKIRQKNKLNPVLIIYPIDKDSTTSQTSAQDRESLKDYAENDIIGLSVVLNPPPENRRFSLNGVSLANIEEAYKNEEAEDNPDENNPYSI